MSSSCWTATIHAAKYVGSVTAKALATYVVAIAGADGIGRVALAEAMLESGDGEVHAGWTAPREEAGLPSAQQHLVSRFLSRKCGAYSDPRFRNAREGPSRFRPQGNATPTPPAWRYPTPRVLVGQWQRQTQINAERNRNGVETATLTAQ
jgi:hypothetical protein